MLDYKQKQNKISATTGKQIFICDKCVTVNDLVNKAHYLLRLQLFYFNWFTAFPSSDYRPLKLEQ